MEREEELEQAEQKPGKIYVCPECGKRFSTLQGLGGHVRMAHGKKEVGVGEVVTTDQTEQTEQSAEQTEIAEKPQQPLPPPPEVEIIEKAIEFLRERLPQVYGIEKYDRIIISSLRDDPRPLVNPSTLHAFIKSIAPRAYDSHLSVHVINPLYARFPNLPQAVVKYIESAYQSQYPMYAYAHYHYVPPQPPYPYYSSYPPNHPYYSYYTYYPPYYYQVPVYSTPPPPRPARTYKVVVDGQEIETDEAGYMAWQRFLREREEHEQKKREHELAMKKLEVEIKKALEEGRGEGKREEELSRKIEELSKKLEEERERRHQAELELLKRELEELKKRPSLLEELTLYEEIARRLGFHRGGRTTIDLLESFVERLDQRAAQLINKIPAPGGEWRPNVKRTPEERARKAEEVMAKLERAEEVIRAEEKLIAAAAKVRPRAVEGGEGKT